MNKKIAIICILFLSLWLFQPNCFAYISDDVNFYKCELNKIIDGVSGEKIRFSIDTNGAYSEKTIDVNKVTLKVENIKTGKTDLNLKYLTHIKNPKPNFKQGLRIARVLIEGKNFWVVEAYIAGPEFAATNKKFWVIGEHSGKMVVYLTENVFGKDVEQCTGFDTYSAKILESSTTNSNTNPPAQHALAFQGQTQNTNNSKITKLAFWDKKAQWFGYVDARNFEYAVKIYNGKRWEDIN